VQQGTLRVGDVFVAGRHSGRVRALLDGQEYTSVALPRDVVINGLHLWINETPRSRPEPPYAGAIISNVVVGQ